MNDAPESPYASAHAHAWRSPGCARAVAWALPISNRCRRRALGVREQSSWLWLSRRPYGPSRCGHRASPSVVRLSCWPPRCSRWTGTAPRPRIRLPGVVWLLACGIAALCVWTAINALTWGCGTCGGDLFGLFELAALGLLTAVVCTLRPSLRSAVVLAILAGGTLEAVLALAGVHGLTPGTADTSAVQGRSPARSAIPMSWDWRSRLRFRRGSRRCGSSPCVPGRDHPRAADRRRRAGADALTQWNPRGGGGRGGRAGARPAAAQPTAAERGGWSELGGRGDRLRLPAFNRLREHAETRRSPRTAVARQERMGRNPARHGYHRRGGAFEPVRASWRSVPEPRAGRQPVHWPGLSGGRYAVTFQVRTVNGSHRVAYGLDDADHLNGPRSARRRRQGIGVGCACAGDQRGRRRTPTSPSGRPRPRADSCCATSRSPPARRPP